MRIIAGSAKGRRLCPPSGEHTRPTTDRVKESIFNIIQFSLPNARVLDLFCGSGQMGIEAVSRGAASCLLVDSDRNASEASRKNVKLCQLENQTEVRCQNAESAVSALGQNSVDIIFLDPPYGGEPMRRILACIYRFDILRARGIMICESDKNDDLGQIVSPYRLMKRYVYGRVAVTTITRDFDGSSGDRTGQL